MKREGDPVSEEAALLEILSPEGTPEWARVSQIDDWALRAAGRAIAHDLREPILGIRRLASWLADLASEDAREDAERYRELLDVRLGRLERRYDALRRFIESGLDSGKREVVDVGDLVREAAAAASDGRDNIRLVLAGERALRISTPRRLLALCLRELFDNAIVHHDRETIELEVTIARRAGSIEIAVADDGPGLDGRVAEELFEPFVGDGERAGMGLALCRRTAALRGGWCELVAREPRGVVATLTWPD